MIEPEEQEPELYKRKYQYQHKPDNELLTGTDWLLLTQAEADMYVFTYINTGTMGIYDGYSDDEDYALVLEELEKATDGERDAYNEGFIEGSSIAVAQERMSNYNGLAFQLNTEEGFDPENFLASLRKMFQCGKCKKNFQFEEAATIGEYYITTELSKDESKNPVLWYVCKGCSLG